MLQTETVNPTLFRVLKGLMSLDEFNSLNLVGVTSLALQMGHRESIDIGLFGSITFNYRRVSKILKAIGEVQLLSQSKHLNILSIDGVKVDFVNYKYPLVEPIMVEEGIRLASKKDIAAMKLSAIAGRGSKKDFIDLFYLLKEFSIDQFYDFYLQKYDDGNLFLVQKSLLYYVDADEQPRPKLFDNVSWEKMKKEIQQKIRA